MITVEQAKSIIESGVGILQKTASVFLRDATGMMLAEDIIATVDLPPFNQSNVDGYAVADYGNEQKFWIVKSEIKAGDDSSIILNAGEACRIFTGAKVPSGAFCVIMQEQISANENTIRLINPEFVFRANEHIRQQGAQIRRGETAIHQDLRITPAVSGFIAALGYDRVMVYNHPEITLVVTGNELQTPGTELPSGKVFESNSFALSAALDEIGLKFKSVNFVEDEKEVLEKKIADVIDNCDLLLISGGISVGDYDFVNAVLSENNVETLFYKVAQKPGKPLYFGRKGETFIFGLPGNPASALTCFYEYVYPCIRRLQGFGELFPEKLLLPVSTPIPKKKGLANFLKAKISNNSVIPLEGQESYRLKSFTEADALIYLPLEKEFVDKGEQVEVHRYRILNY